MAQLPSTALVRPRPRVRALLAWTLLTGLLLGGSALLAGRLPGLGALEEWRRVAIAVLALTGSSVVAVAVARHRSPAPAGIGVGLLVAADVAVVHAVGTSLLGTAGAAAAVAAATYVVIFGALGLHLLTLKVLGNQPVSRAASIRDALRRPLPAPRARAAARTSSR